MTDRQPSAPSTTPLDTELTSPQLQFYLKHRVNIETWAALKNDVRKATRELLADLQDELGGIASGYGEDVAVRYDDDGMRYPRLMLRRPEWPMHDQKASLGVGMEWVEKVDPSGKEPPYYGIRVARGAPGGKELLEAMRARAREVAVFPKPYVFTGLDWPVFRYMDRDPDWWTDLPAWRQRVIDEVVACWELAVPFVDAVMAQAAHPDEND